MSKLTKKDILTLRLGLAKELRANDGQWKLRKGLNEWLFFLENYGEIGRKDAMTATCYHCCGGYEDGPFDCKGYTCPMYDYMPYKDERSRKEMTDEQKVAISKRLMEARNKK